MEYLWGISEVPLGYFRRVSGVCLVLEYYEGLINDFWGWDSILVCWSVKGSKKLIYIRKSWEILPLLPLKEIVSGIKLEILNPLST